MVELLQFSSKSVLSLMEILLLPFHSSLIFGELFFQTGIFLVHLQAQGCGFLVVRQNSPKNACLLRHGLLLFGQDGFVTLLALLQLMLMFALSENATFTTERF